MDRKIFTDQQLGKPDIFHVSWNDQDKNHSVGNLDKVYAINSDGLNSTEEYNVFFDYLFDTGYSEIATERWLHKTSWKKLKSMTRLDKDGRPSRMPRYEYGFIDLLTDLEDCTRYHHRVLDILMANNVTTEDIQQRCTPTRDTITKVLQYTFGINEQGASLIALNLFRNEGGLSNLETPRTTLYKECHLALTDINHVIQAMEEIENE